MEQPKKFFRSKKPDGFVNCRDCTRPINRGQWIGWDRNQKGVAWHFNCQDMNGTPPYDLQYHRGDNGAPATSSNGVASQSDADEMVDDAAVSSSSNGNGKVDHSDGLGAFASVLAPYLDGKINAKADSAIADLRTTLKAEFDTAVQKLRDATTLTVKVELPSGEVKTIVGAHDTFPKLLKIVRRRLMAYLHGPAGSFKSTAAKQAANATGLPFESISLNVQTFESRLIGFIDAGGKYHDTGLRRCYENGGVYLIDEMDNASGNLLTTINMLLANGHFTFPDKTVERHADFVCIATGNTSGRGASRNHSDRRALDAATLDRFVSVPWDYDWKLTRALAKSINPDCDTWVDWIIAANTYCRKELPQVLCTPRSVFSGATLMLEEFSMGDIAEMTVFKGLDADSIRRIVTACPLPKGA